MYMRCVLQYSAVSTKTVALPSFTNKTGQYKSVLSLYFQCLVQTWTNFQVIYDARKHVCNVGLIKLIIWILVSAIFEFQTHAYIGWGFPGTGGTWATDPGHLVLTLFQLVPSPAWAPLLLPRVPWRSLMGFFLSLHLSLKEVKLSLICCKCQVPFQDAALLHWNLRCCWNRVDSLSKLCSLPAILSINPKEGSALRWKLHFLYVTAAEGCQWHRGTIGRVN